MKHRICSVRAKENCVIEATFSEGTVKEYGIKALFAKFPQLAVLQDPVLFETACVDTGGYGISWNDELDLDGDTIWEEGKQI